ncbi:hypothetical protein J6590_044652 [Homalodisca vitripennis]|nr:hypothetical protein J6590_044652 [Homalodisca vitripennis]
MKINKDVWRIGYKIVAKTIGRKAPQLDPALERACADRLFPNTSPQIITSCGYSPLHTGGAPYCWRKARREKSPGPGGIPAKAVKEEELDAKGGLSDRQFGFWKGRSTVDTVTLIKDLVKEDAEGTRHSRKIPTVILLDAKNAFNSAFNGLLFVIMGFHA